MQQASAVTDLEAFSSSIKLVLGARFAGLLESLKQMYDSVDPGEQKGQTESKKEGKKKLQRGEKRKEQSEKERKKNDEGETKELSDSDLPDNFQ